MTVLNPENIPLIDDPGYGHKHYFCRFEVLPVIFTLKRDPLFPHWGKMRYLLVAIPGQYELRVKS